MTNALYTMNNELQHQPTMTMNNASNNNIITTIKIRDVILNNYYN